MAGAGPAETAPGEGIPRCPQVSGVWQPYCHTSRWEGRVCRTWGGDAPGLQLCVSLPSLCTRSALPAGTHPHLPQSCPVCPELSAVTRPVLLGQWRPPSPSGSRTAAGEAHCSRRTLGSGKKGEGASLVAQWLRICLLMQGTRVRALVWEDPTCHGAAGPVSHNY